MRRLPLGWPFVAVVLGINVVLVIRLADVTSTVGMLVLIFLIVPVARLITEPRRRNPGSGSS